MLLPPTTQMLDIPDANIRVYTDVLDETTASAAFTELKTSIRWHQETIILYGKPRLQPRLSAWYGEPDAVYRYSGLTLYPQPWTPCLQHLRERIETLLNTSFNSVLLNLYRHGQDSMGWHSDDEPELGQQPLIASLSLGAVRRFRLRHKHRRHPGIAVNLTPGSVLVMAGVTQDHWQHCVPKTQCNIGARINLTWRRIV